MKFKEGSIIDVEMIGGKTIHGLFLRRDSEGYIVIQCIHGFPVHVNPKYLVTWSRVDASETDLELYYQTADCYDD